MEKNPMKRLLLGSVFALCATAAWAQDAGRITGHRVYVIWEETGNMSPDWSQRPQIVANERKLGSSMQARVDIVIEGKREGMIDDTLEVSAKTDDGKVTGYSLPVGFLSSGKLVRSIIVTHGCNPFSVEARLGKSTRSIKVDLTCGG
jgi:uncharacterized protein YfaP (DUF2135 family)